MNAPCYQCPERHELCHATCEKYQTYNAEQERIREERRAQRDATDIRNSIVLKRYREILNAKKRRGKKL